ncbi:MAG TPA: glycosyltransferase family 39 protein [Gaiellaceae bacterium]|nr:glycosyltransferase family 39 protein [Gaiellaceae bacterium]
MAPIVREVSVRHSTAALVVVLAASIPRLLVLARERETILEEFVDKSDRFAVTLVEHGTFGFLPGVPSAYTQPLYGWFLAGLYLPFDRSWLAVGLAQIALAVATALLVLEIGVRLRSPGVGLVAALLTTLHPYLVWHDVHANREVLDGLVLALLVLCALLAYENRSLAMAAATGCVAGLAILGNTRLVLLPVAIGFFVAGRVPVARTLAAAALVVAGAALVVAPWVARNKVEIGCYAITTDARALWKANNPATRGVLDRGGWIDDVPELRGAPPWPELAADLTLAGTPTSVDECAQMRLYRDEVLEFWRENPGEKARLAAQATRMLWNPIPSESDASGSGAARIARRTVEPAFMVGLYILAIAGLFVAPRHFVALALLLLAYNTLAAMVFAGTARYRAPWDFLLALLAAFALAEIWQRLRRRRGYTAAALRAR